MSTAMLPLERILQASKAYDDVSTGRLGSEGFQAYEPIHLEHRADPAPPPSSTGAAAAVIAFPDGEAL